MEIKLIAKRDDGNRKSYDIEIGVKQLTVYETITEKGNTHTFAVHSMKKSPTEEEENAAVLFVKKLTEEKEKKQDAIITSIATRDKTTKPWGSETLLSICPLYAFKEIKIKAGQRTSLQYHLKKHETLVFVEGEAVIHCKNSMGEMVKVPAPIGTVAEFPPLVQHRIEAKTDIRYFEASTQELKDDTIRIDDDYGRRMVKA